MALNPEFIATPSATTTDDFAAFDIANHGGWGHDLQVDCTCEGASKPLVTTYPQGSADFRITFDALPLGPQFASFVFHKKDDPQELARLEYAWEIVE